MCYKSFRYNKEYLDKEAQNWVIEKGVIVRHGFRLFYLDA